MFNLDQAIVEWRRQMAAGGVNTPEVLNELESHLRDDVEEQIQSGLMAQQAFDAAAGRIGHAQALQQEFDKVGRIRKHRDRPQLTTAGCSENYMNTNSPHVATSLERWWATYIKGAAFLVPAVCLWAFSAVFLFPKVEQICRDSGIRSNMNDAVVFHKIIAFHNVMIFFADHGVVLSTGIVLALILLEWRSSRWPRYRHASIGVAVFVVNAAVLLLITAMFTLTLMAAPALFHAK